MLKLTRPTADEIRTFLDRRRGELTPDETRRLRDLATDIDNITPKRTQTSVVMMNLLDDGLRFYAEIRKRFGEHCNGRTGP